MRKLILVLSVAFIVALMLTACGGDGGAEDEPVASAGDAVAGEDLFLVCAGCHGPDAKGLPNNGKDLTTSAFLKDLTDDEFVAFIKTGRSISDPENTTGVDMPPKGGNPAFSEEDLVNIVAYVRTLAE
ncbi:MAG: cytochrome c [Candidatus Promineifilaceae bacterium]